jgi:hypothetical protein
VSFNLSINKNIASLCVTYLYLGKNVELFYFLVEINKDELVDYSEIIIKIKEK